MCDWAWRALTLLVAVAAILALPFVFSTEEVLNSQFLNAWFAGSPPSRGAAYLYFVASSAWRSTAIVLACAGGSLVAGAAIDSWHPRITRSLAGVASALRFLPAIAWLPLTMAVFGLTTLRGQSAFVALGVCPLFVFHFLQGIQHCEPEKLAVAQLSGASRLRTTLMLKVPNARGDIWHGFRLSLGLGFVLAVVYEAFSLSTPGVCRIVEITEVVRYPTSDLAAFVVLLFSCGLLLDQMAVAARDAHSAVSRWYEMSVFCPRLATKTTHEG